MRIITLLLLSAFTSHTALAQSTEDVAIAIHGGAGTISKAKLTPEQDLEYRAILRKAAEHGYSLLKKGVEGDQVVVETLQILEMSPLFNAGVGAVYTFDEAHELDASIMHGANKEAGAVAGVKRIKSPIHAAQLVMKQSEHVMLTGKGAEVFSKEQGLTMVDNSFFNTQKRLDALKKVKISLQAQTSSIKKAADFYDYKFGTVGAVVKDAKGNLVAGTTTGGMTAKRYGRVGDSPIIGAGTFADNASCAVSATGHGEYFIRFNVASDICARVKYQKLSIADAGKAVINDELADAGGTGGVIIIDNAGNISMPFNTEGMYRASIDPQGTLYVGIYSDE